MTTVPSESLVPRYISHKVVYYKYEYAPYNQSTDTAVQHRLYIIRIQYTLGLYHIIYVVYRLLRDYINKHIAHTNAWYSVFDICKLKVFSVPKNKHLLSQPEHDKQAHETLLCLRTT